MLRKLSDEIFKLEVPFENIYTAVFFVKTKKGFTIIDTADKASDAENYILPAMKEFSISEDSVTAILLTHTHGDHVGGTAFLVERCKNAYVYGFSRPGNLSEADKFITISDGDIIDESIKAVELKGHDLSNGGFLHLPSKSLFSGDSIQLYGLYVYALGVGYPKHYFESLEKLKMTNIKNIFASHDFVPLGASAIGEKAVNEYISTAEKCLCEMIDFVKANLQDGITETTEIQRLFIEEKQKLYKDFPTASFETVIDSIKKECM